MVSSISECKLFEVIIIYKGLLLVEVKPNNCLQKKRLTSVLNNSTKDEILNQPTNHLFTAI